MVIDIGCLLVANVSRPYQCGRLSIEDAKVVSKRVNSREHWDPVDQEQILAHLVEPSQVFEHLDVQQAAQYCVVLS